MKWRKLIAAGVLAMTLSFSGAAHAQSNVDDPAHEARVEAFPTNVKIDGNTSLLWILFVLLSIASMSVLFKDSRRARTE